MQCACGCGAETKLAKATNSQLGHIAGRPLKYLTGHYLRKLKTVVERLNRTTTANEMTACLEWNGASVPKGYGVLWYQGRQTYVHRALWVELRGEIPDGMFICHHCDNPRCVNINHLFVGSPKDNMLDMIQKGRANFRGART